VIGVGQELDVVADRAPDHGDAFSIRLDRQQADLHFEDAKATGGVSSGFSPQFREHERAIAVVGAVIAAGRIRGDAIAERPAEQRMDRLTERLAP
jgi:hypothetical protein